MPYKPSDSTYEPRTFEDNDLSSLGIPKSDYEPHASPGMQGKKGKGIKYKILASFLLIAAVAGTCGDVGDNISSLIDDFKDETGKVEKILNPPLRPMH
ncbi:hypothetical protein ACFL1B_03445 [Nanoarchaeota archaeon]